MNFLSLLPIFSTLIERLFPDKAKQDEAKLEMQKVLNESAAKQAEADAAKMESQSKVIVSEAQSQSYAARNWRPHLMYLLMLVVGYNYMLAPVLKSMGMALDIFPMPSEMWTLLTVGLGGYIGGDALKQYTTAKFNDKAFYDQLRKDMGGLDQATVEKLDRALKQGEQK